MVGKRHSYFLCARFPIGLYKFDAVILIVRIALFNNLKIEFLGLRTEKLSGIVVE